MSLPSFAIRFKFETQFKDGQVSRKKPHIYQANINTLSHAFSLFEVTGIKKITKTRTIRIPGSYYLTSYPLFYAGQETWKDAVTTNADKFLQAIGDAIERYVTAPRENSTCLN